jgi:hypothetical protein
MAVKKETTVRVRVRTAFNDMRVGDTATVPLNERVQAWIELGFVELVESGGYGVSAYGEDQA